MVVVVVVVVGGVSCFVKVVRYGLLEAFAVSSLVVVV